MSHHPRPVSQKRPMDPIASEPAKPAEKERSGGRLSLVATPIGNLEDITLRALRCLREADLIVAEDTRHTRKLLTHYDIHCPLISYYKDIEKQKTAELVEAVSQGKRLALVTDAGTPGISDPGVYLVQEAKRQGMTVEIIPGPSALVTALLGSGLPIDNFSFFGFLGSKSGERRKALEQLQHRTETLVFFASPHRLSDVLQDMLDTWGDRQAVLCREMTKIHEEFRAGLLSDLVEHTRAMSRGEYTLVVAGSSQSQPQNQVEESIPDELSRLQKQGLSLNHAIAHVARHRGIPRAQIYALAHALDKKSN